jgi:uncharacterized membrane protein (UPF0136 family)
MIVVPIQRIGVIAAFSFAFSGALKQNGIKKVLLYITCLVIHFITAAGSLFWRLSMPVPMILITAGLPTVSGYFLYKKLQPREPEVDILLTPGNEVN